MISNAEGKNALIQPNPVRQKDKILHSHGMVRYGKVWSITYGCLFVDWLDCELLVTERNISNLAPGESNLRSQAVFVCICVCVCVCVYVCVYVCVCVCVYVNK